MVDYYEILGLPYTATDSQIGEVYRRLKIESEGNLERLGQIEEAYAILANPIRRKKYLASLITTQPGGTQVPPEGTFVHPLPPHLSTKDLSEPGSSHKQTTESFEPGQEVRTQPSIQPSKPKISPGSRINRQPTEFIDSKQENKPAISQQAGKPAAQPVSQRKRQPTEFIESGQEIKSAKPRQADKPATQPAPHTKRQPTEFIEPDQAAKPGPRQPTIEPPPPPPARPARLPTEFYEPEQQTQPETPAKVNIPSKPSPGRGSRLPTEYYEPEKETKPEQPNQSGFISEPPQVSQGRQPTDFNESELNEEPQDEPQMLQTPPPSLVSGRHPTEHPVPFRDIPNPPKPGSRLPTSPMDQIATQAPKEPYQGPLAGQRKDYYVQVSYLGNIETFPLKAGKNIIGRPPQHGPLPDILLTDPTKYISRKQAIISVEGNQLTITDPGSSNGTFLNSVRMVPMQVYPLTENDVISIEERELCIKPLSYMK